MYNVVLIGCGHMGEVHLNDIYLRDDVNIYGVVDVDIEKAKLFAKKFGADSFHDDYMHYITDEKCDIVICASYTQTHLDVLKACVKYKKHLLCEKPIAADIDKAKEFVNLVKTADIKVLVGHILRHNETYKKAVELIHSGAIGSPLTIRMSQNHHVMSWKKYRALLEGASPIVDCGVHYIDVCRWATGAEVVEVGGISSVMDSECPEGQFNYGLMTMRLSDGSVAFYEAGWGGSIAADNTKEFIGPKGSIRIVERTNRVTAQEEGDLIELYNKETKEHKIINVDCIRRPTGAQLKHLIKMIEENVEAVPTIDEVLTSLSVAIKGDKVLRERKKNI